MSPAYLAIVAIAAVIGLASAWRPALALRSVIVLAAGYPYAQPWIFHVPQGGPLALHPVTWAVAAAGLVAFGRSGGRSMRILLVRYRYAAIGAALLVIAGVWWTLRARGHAPGPQLVDQVVVPFALMLWARAVIDADPEELRRLPRFVVLLGAAEAIIAVVGTARHFQSVWGVGTDFGRQAATLDGPLPLALLLVTCVPLTVTIRSSVARIMLTAMLLLGVLTTQSRTGLVIGVICAGFIIFSGTASIAFRVVVLLLAPVLIVGIVQSTVVSGVASRFADDLGSSALRSDAGDSFWASLDRWIWAGHGVGASYQVAVDAGLQTSYENAFYMYAIDYGLIVTLLAGGAVALQVLHARPWRGRVANGGVAAAVACVVFCLGFSSIATESLCGPVLWLAIAFGSTPILRRDQVPDPEAARPIGGLLSAAR